MFQSRLESFFRQNIPGRWLDRIQDHALNLIAPQFCRICGQPVTAWADGVACRACWAANTIGQSGYFLACLRCGRWKQSADVSERVPPQQSCDQCSGASYAVARSCGPYEGALRVNLLALKRQPFLPATLKTLICESWQRFPELHAVDMVLPVPLAARRVAERGYNQAGLLGSVVSRETGVLFEEKVLIRAVETERHRAGMDVVARRKSVERAFRVVCPRLIRGKSVLLVDDVMTSGATLEACTTELLKAGAAEVRIFTAARTMRYHG